MDQEDLKERKKELEIELVEKKEFDRLKKEVKKLRKQKHGFFWWLFK